jgi:hypothetical protein
MVVQTALANVCIGRSLQRGSTFLNRSNPRLPAFSRHFTTFAYRLSTMLRFQFQQFCFQLRIFRLEAPFCCLTSSHFHRNIHLLLLEAVYGQLASGNLGVELFASLRFQFVWQVGAPDVSAEQRSK